MNLNIFFIGTHYSSITLTVSPSIAITEPLACLPIWPVSIRICNKQQNYLCNQQMTSGWVQYSPDYHHETQQVTTWKQN